MAASGERGAGSWNQPRGSCAERGQPKGEAVAVKGEAKGEEAKGEAAKGESNKELPKGEAKGEAKG